MKTVLSLALVLAVVGCARGKMGMVTQELDRAKVSKSTPIMVMPVTTKDIRFSGDKADDQIRITEEKQKIEDTYHRIIVQQLRDKGYKAKVINKATDEGIVIKGNVRRFDHGSGAARFWVGMGAGASNMYTDFKVLDMANKKVLGDFEVIATSGGRGGLSAVGSFMDAHLTDGAEKCAEYIANEHK